MKIEFKYCKDNTLLQNTLDLPASDKNFRFFRFKSEVFLSSDSGLAQSKPDDFYLRSPGTNLSIEPKSNDAYYDELVFSGVDAKKLVSLSSVDLNYLLSPLQSHFAESLFSKIKSEISNKNSYWKEVCASYLLELLTKTVRMVDHDLVETMPDHAQKLRVLRAEIHENFSAPWTINQMSEKMGLSTSRFASLYKQEFKISPTEDLIQTRIDQSKKMLSASKVSIKKVSAACGFESVHYFHRAFKKRVFITPKHFQNSKFVDEGSVSSDTRQFSLDRMLQQSEYSGIIEIIDGEIHFHGNTSHVSQLLGYPPEELREKPFINFVAPISASAAEGGVAQILSSRNVLDLSVELLHLKGYSIPISFSALLKGKNWFWFIKQITPVAAC